MEVVNSVQRFDQAVSGLCDRLSAILTGIPRSAKETAFEVRLRVGMPLALTCPNQCWFVDPASRLSNLPKSGVVVTKTDIEQSVVKMCSYSLHTHQNELKNGFIALHGGHRAGICGTAVVSGGKIESLRDVTSVNLRIAREVRGAADPLMEQVFSGGPKGVLITGAPSSGKTTVLRDLARQLSDGRGGHFYRVAVVDERGEIAAVSDGLPQNNLGYCCDVLNGYPRGEGILTAVRTLSPQVILCDEIGGEEEVRGMLDGVNCGVKIIATAHAASFRELLGRRQIRLLLEAGVFDTVVMLGSADNPGEIRLIAEAGDLLAESGGDASGSPVFFDERRVSGLGAFREGFRA